MNTLSNLLPWLSDALLQCTVLLAVILLAQRALRKASASKQHALLLSSAFAIPLLFILSAVLPIHQIRQTHTPPHPTQNGDHAFTTSTEFGRPVRQTNAPVGPSPLTSPDRSNPANPTLQEPTPLPLTSWLAVIWLLGITLAWLRLGIGIISLVKIKTQLQAPRIQQLIATESTRLNLPKPPRLFLLDDLTMPRTWWLGEHHLALPQSSTDWPLEKLLHVIRHELAHIQRHDCQRAWIAQASLALLWFHPLTWVLKRALNTTREIACDDLALTHCSDLKSHQNYARHLLDIVTSHSRTSQTSDPALAMTRNNSDLQRRLKAILDQHQDRRPVSTRSRYLTRPLWLLGLTALASLSACRITEPASPPTIPPLTPAPDSSVEISTTVIELENPAILRKLFNMNEDELQFASVITVERMEEILKKLPTSKSQTTKLPKVITTIGRKGKSERTREFIYPTEYSPPQFAKTDKGVVGGTTSFPVTPASPISFETKMLGLTCEFTPNLAAGQNIDLEIAIDHSHFLGFVNYGSPIMAPAKTILGSPTQVVITENRIEMPIFRSHRFKTSYNLPPGHVVVLVGLPLENSPDLDKVTRIHRTGKQKEIAPAKATLYLVSPEILQTP